MNCGSASGRFVSGALCAAALGFTLTAAAQTAQESPAALPPSAGELAKLKQNPVSGLRQIGFQAVFNPETPANQGKTQANYSLQPVWPFKVNDDWRLITYTIVPVIHQPAAAPDGSSVTGLGDTVVNLFFSPTKPGNLVWGLGPVISLPTRTDPALGPNRAALGPSAVLYYAKDAWGAGVVVQNAWSFGGTGINKVNVFAAQYILNYNLPNGWFLYSNSTITSNWNAPSSDRWTVPVGGGFGKVFNIGKQPVSASVQGFYNVETPTNGPKWSGIFQFSFLFP
jgi:hypothetical protein